MSERPEESRTALGARTRSDLSGATTAAAKRAKAEMILELAVNGFSVSQIAEKTGIRRGTVRRYLSRAAKQLRENPIDLKELVAKALVRNDGRRRFLVESRDKAEDAAGASMVANAETKIDDTEMKMLQTVGVLTKMSGTDGAAVTMRDILEMIREEEQEERLLGDGDGSDPEDE